MLRTWWQANRNPAGPPPANRRVPPHYATPDVTPCVMLVVWCGGLSAPHARPCRLTVTRHYRPAD